MHLSSLGNGDDGMNYAIPCMINSFLSPGVELRLRRTPDTVTPSLVFVLRGDSLLRFLFGFPCSVKKWEDVGRKCVVTWAISIKLIMGRVRRKAQAGWVHYEAIMGWEWKKRRTRTCWDYEALIYYSPHSGKHSQHQHPIDSNFSQQHPTRGWSSRKQTKTPKDFTGDWERRLSNQTKISGRKKIVRQGQG